MIKSKLIRVSHNRLFRSKIKHRNHGRRIGSSDICPDVSSSVSCPINFSYTHNTTIRGQYIDTFTPFINQLRNKTDSQTPIPKQFFETVSPFRNAKTTRAAIYRLSCPPKRISANSRPAERSDGNGSIRRKETGIQQGSQPRRFTAGRGEA